MERKNQSSQSWELDSHLPHLTTGNLAFVNYTLPRYLTDEQHEVLKILILNRIESVLMDIPFTRNTLAIVESIMDPYPWGKDFPVSKTFYDDERRIVDEMFTDIEATKDYSATMAKLKHAHPKQFQVTNITETQICLMLYQ